MSLFNLLIGFLVFFWFMYYRKSRSGMERGIRCSDMFMIGVREEAFFC